MVALAVSLWVSAPALGQADHVFGGSLPSAGACVLDSPRGVAVNEGTGEVYVLSAGNEEVVEFGQAPEYKCLGAFKVKEPEGAIVVDNSASPSSGDVYVATEEAVYKFDGEGNKLATLKGFKERGEEKEEFGQVHGIALDSHGDLYVYREESIVRFDASLKPNKTLSNLETLMDCERLSGFAVDPGGEGFYVGTELETREEGCVEGQRVIAKLNGKGAVVSRTLDGERATAVTVALSGGNAGDAYVENGSSIATFDAEGALVQRFGAGHLEEGRGIAVDGSARNLYVADAKANAVEVFEELSAKPAIDEVASQNVTPTSTELSARIDPKGSDTHYYFQYGSADCATPPASCATVPAEPGGDLGGGFGDQAVSVQATGLQPGTDYFFRVIASNGLGSVGATASVNRFTTLPVAQAVLADGRAWELVSPAEKDGASVLPLTVGGEVGGLIEASEDGGGIAYAADAPLGQGVEGNRAPETSEALSSRTPAGWVTRDITTPKEEAEGVEFESASEYQFFSPDLAYGLVEPQPDRNGQPLEKPPLSPEAGEKTIYRRANTVCGAEPQACYQPLVTAGNVPAGTKFGEQLKFADAAPDLEHVVFESEVPLVNGAPGAGLYEWQPGAPLTLVSVLPGSGPAGEPELGDSALDTRNAVSVDGSRVIWTGVDGEGHQHLYLRDTVSRETLQLDKAQEGMKEPEPLSAGGVHFQSASADGSRIFFTALGRLTAESTLPEEELEERGEGADLYECEVVQREGKSACNLADLTVGSLGESADVQGNILVSEDGSYVYFVADGRLAHGAIAGSCGRQAQAGLCSLYMEHFNSAQMRWEEPVAIAVLSGEDEPDWIGNHASELDFMTSRVSPNGRYLTFMSQQSLTGYNNTDRKSGQPDQEVFLYDAVAKRLVCASCNPDGEPPAGVLDTEGAGEGLGLLVDRPKIWEGHWLAGSIPGWSAIEQRTAHYQSRYLSNEGRIFFDSADPLVPTDHNGKEDVYLYEPPGVGSCSKRCVSLISSGTSKQESAFVDASANGDNAFFVTSAQLVADDHDQSFDLYDARVCTSASPCLESQVANPSRCESEPSPNACRGPESVPPSYAAPTSETSSASGNLPQHATAPSKTRHAAKRTRAQLLAKALKTCRQRYRRNKRKRDACERRARHRYGAKKPAKKVPERRRGKK